MGSQREDDFDLLLSRIKQSGMSEKEYSWYLDLYENMVCSTFWFWNGVERMVRWMTVLEHIRECIPFPRTINRLKLNCF